MKALSLAAGLAIALAGTACSEQVPAEPENVSAETAAPAAVETPAANTSSRSRFNLRMPGGGTAPAPQPQTSGGFNLRTPDAPASTNDIPMPAGSASSTLADVPEVAVPGLNNPAADIATRSRTEAPTVNTEDDDDIIRLD